jgi:aspartate/methionine/tyrosine aminotransferase
VFSSRLPHHLEPNALSLATTALEAAGVDLLDLTETNPTNVGLAYSSDVLACMSNPAAARYQPSAFGLLSAREAVAADYARKGTPAAADRIVLTASTSEAYSLLFKLLCDPGDNVLVPQPSYPLFELLTALDGVPASPYRLDYNGAWTIDRDSVEKAISARTRAILAVSPNNPTGSMLREDDRDWLVGLCGECTCALIVDEVFIDYPLAPRRDARSIVGEDRALTFSLGGMSKSAGLPQVKLGWIVAGGPEPMVTKALSRLEVICDSYLSVSTPVQLAAPALIASGRVIRAAIAERLEQNLGQLRRRLTASPSVTLLEPEGGWSAVLQVPATEPEEALVMRLLKDEHVRVHPGYFFDFPREAYLVVSLLPEPRVFATAIDRVLAAIEKGLS